MAPGLPNMSEREQQRSRVKHSSSYDGCFDENSPRPPVPGEERAHCVTDWALPVDWTLKAASPTPRKSYYSDSYSMGFEPEGSAKSRSHEKGARSPYEPSPPPCVQWAESLHRLLQDRDGVELFMKYLESEGKAHADALEFWFACEGLQKQDEPKLIRQLIKVIHRRFFRESALPVKDETRRKVEHRIKTSPDPDLFKKAQKEVEDHICDTTYPSFLKSDMYLSYIHSVQNPAVGGDFSDSSSSSSAVSARELASLATGLGLPTLHEDMEFMGSAPLNHTPGTGCMSTGYHTPNVGVRLTKDILLATQRRRALDVRPKPEAYADKFLYRGMGARAAYNSYNPVSRQESELQSLSSHSDARTESDSVSLTDLSVDGKTLHRPSRRHTSITKQVQEMAARNKEINMHHMVIPRTQRMDARQYHATDPATFAPILIEKLEKLRREQESQELLNRKLMEGDSMSSLDEKTRLSTIPSTVLASAMREKLQLEDDNDQDILDQHVSRVFSDLTPARSPGVASPRPYSPSRNRWSQEPYRQRRKDKDGFSTFSSDSGNVHDFPEGYEHKMGMVKSKSLTEYADERDRFVRSASSRRSSSKKTIADLTDSGVSVVSDTPPVSLGTKENRVLAWVMESERGGRGLNYTHSELSSGKHSTSRHRKAFTGSRSSSIDRASAGGLVPAQPFVADPNMPPLPPPNTATQLEETRRRLLEDDVRNSRHKPKLLVTSTSSQSTLRKSVRVKPPADDFTTVVFTFCDEDFPYRTKIPGRQVTLKQFKEYLPKKGNYRFFFKTECEELNNQVIQEEVSNDADLVPLYEGKIMAQVKSID